MNTFSQVPPGFRFHPTDEELLDYYLRRKVTYRQIDVDVIKDVDLYKIEPWDLQGLCRIGNEEQNEWYFFSHKDKKYPSGTRTNRATAVGFWKATGRDKAIYSKHELIGMRKTLVFYKGGLLMARNQIGSCTNIALKRMKMQLLRQEEGWVVCKVFKKRIAATSRKFSEHDSPIWYDDHVSFMPEVYSPNQTSHPNLVHNHHHSYTCCKSEMELQYATSSLQFQPDHNYLNLPFLESPKIQISNFAPVHNINHENTFQDLDQNFSSATAAVNNGEISIDHVTDWRVLDKFVASQLSHGETDVLDKNTSTSASNQNVDELWK